MSAVLSFNIGIPTNSLQQSSDFYSKVIGAKELSQGDNHIDYDFYGHHLRVYFLGQ